MSEQSHWYCVTFLSAYHDVPVDAAIQTVTAPDSGSMEQSSGNI